MCLICLRNKIEFFFLMYLSNVILRDDIVRVLMKNDTKKTIAFFKGVTI